MKYFVVSDIHGFYSKLLDALVQNKFDENNINHKLIICGDLMDRGSEALDLQEYIVNLISKDRVILIKGNHEYLAEDYIRNITDIYYNGTGYYHHYVNGTINTFFQLTGNFLKDWDVIKYKKDCLNTPYISFIMKHMINYYETKNYIFVHGYIPVKECNSLRVPYEYNPSWRNASTTDFKNATWYNGMKMCHEYKIKEPNKTIVCGHWNCSYGHSYYEHDGSEYDSNANYNPYYEDGLIAIDACTAVSKKVNCIVIEDEDF